jgi:type II secretory ATPase GspE/PulE/Tfp pilus assembly ATPase PilB-like protein
VRYRIDGLLSEALAVPTSAQEEVISHIKILADMDISERRLPQDGHITLEHDGRFYDLRVSTLPASGGEKIVIRILDAANGLQKLDEIVQSDADKKAFMSLIANPYGMILLTGPTGCGKTTTLYSMLQILNTAERNIVTVEDPVEYQLRGITQVQVKPEINITFASTLRSVLRQDPNVILIGEIRDEETAEIAVSASLTGHLVLSTLHANTAAGAVLRLLNLEIPAYQAAAALLGAASQRLLRSICPQCKTAYKPSQEEMDILAADGQKIKELYRGRGCDNCRGTGYSGRMAVYELMAVTPEVRGLIAEAASEDAIKSAAVRNGMKTLRMSAAEQVIAGRTTLSEMMRAIDIREK